MRRLRFDAPELHAEVVAGMLSAHAAMLKGRSAARHLQRPRR
ncbi:hypothetical protein [Actinopolymorpha pittospori]|uniref:Uncharacterized protein n=1 Tax=Actinopolymorpha pittospori TaxID=648752 RepID=A0A927MPZ1_9ACTN|nr:hypothetical protein [Actinopolymorpha pittospori]MBE1604745.1 hypothetical protein [Actinopolymorpha pittospori]